MKRWNGWGDESVKHPLPEAAARFLEERVGPAKATPDAPLASVVGQVPESRLTHHPAISTDPANRLRHARGHSLPDWVALRSGRIGVFPDGVAYPISGEDVRALIDYAAQTGARLIPYGGGTSVVGHINPLAGDAPVLSVDVSRMNRLLHLDERTRLATFGAGVNGPNLEAQLRAHGLTLGHYPQSFEYSTLGGWIATRSSGQQSLHYGRIERLFAGGTLETPAGTLQLPGFPASAAGPDLRELVLGSEGRLGFITEAVVRVSALPERETFRAIFFPTFEAGMEAVREMVQAGLPLSMLRLSTAVETETTLQLAGHAKAIDTLERLLRLRGVGEGKSLLMLGYSGTKSLARATLRAAYGIAGRHGGAHLGVGGIFGAQWNKARFRTPYLRNTLWERGYAVDTLETATTWTRTPATIAAIEDALRQTSEADNERLHCFTHLSHVYPHGTSIYTSYIFRLSPDPDETLARWQRLKRAASQAVIDCGGTISHQHGVGTDHAPYLPAEKGALGIDALGALCRHFDPDGLMNPGKLLL